MAHLTYNDIRPFTVVHPTDNGHEVLIVATDQVHLICYTCGIDVTVDAVDAGHAVQHDEEAK